MTGKLRIGLLFLVLMVATIAAAVGWSARLFNAPGPLDRATVVLLPQGLGLKQVAARLDDAGAISPPLLFVAMVQLSGDARRLRAGEYLIPEAASMRAIRDLLKAGETVVHRFTVAEGLTSRQVAELLRAEPALKGEIRSVPAEGSLLPETYHFSHGDQRNDLLRRMTGAMDETLATLWPQRAPGVPLAGPWDAVILASIVERETARADERGRIAGVFMNRLRRGMRLQSDPTVAYGLNNGEALERPLSRADLDRETPYNTYLIGGLPPGPIANPGREALAAVLNPSETDELYFVADGTGGHAFAVSHAEHLRNVRKWRRIQAQDRN
ncbi:MAG: endolytic transglycosylase MltG [Sphingomonadales bacterium]